MVYCKLITLLPYSQRHKVHALLDSIRCCIGYRSTATTAIAETREIRIGDKNELLLLLLAVTTAAAAAEAVAAAVAAVACRCCCSSNYCSTSSSCYHSSNISTSVVRVQGGLDIIYALLTFLCLRRYH